MSEWSAGYVSGIDYSYGYYEELNPLRAAPIILNRGQTHREIKTACELGIGQGVSIVTHAVSSGIQWYGNDFNPSHINYARSLIPEGVNNIHLSDSSFEEYLKDTSLPNFDFISLHGIWSWVRDVDRDTILKFISQKLNPGGLLYISYNVNPGWAPFLPLRNIMKYHYDLLGNNTSSSSERVRNSLEFLKNINEHSGYVKLYDKLSTRVDSLSDHGEDYIAHEYLNDNWHVSDHITVRQRLEDIKLTYAGNVDTMENVEALMFSPGQLDILNKIPNSRLQEYCKDFFRNNSFRKEYYIKGSGKPLTARSLLEQLESYDLLLVKNLDGFDYKQQCGLGEADLNKDTYGPIFELLSDKKRHSFKEIRQLPGMRDSNHTACLEVMNVLIGGKYCRVCQSTESESVNLQNTRTLNELLINNSRYRSEASVLASPTLGAGAVVNRFSQIFVGYYLAGARSKEDLVSNTINLLNSQDEKLVGKKDRKILDEDGMSAELTKQAETFLSIEVPYLKSMNIL